MLGAVLAGGQSSRFGSDKALATLAGSRLIDHAMNALCQLCDEVVVVGGNRQGIMPLADWPAPGLGPLGGIAAALRYASEQGHSEVLTCGVDSLGLPLDLLRHLSPGPAYVMDQQVVGLWPSAAFDRLADILTGSGRRSILAFAQTIGARSVRLEKELANINTPEDLSELEKRHGV